ncbi:gastrokine-1 [Pantherophis guttatus]|uniref:Gastrokine-1 n=1 Tax=Pantherophis guttatus TaxID=94885 RepID=A0A6P9D4G8_PANGU|nr:gastrokine-1 [Pantherophis guttatus]
MEFEQKMHLISRRCVEHWTETCPGHLCLVSVGHALILSAVFLGVFLAPVLTNIIENNQGNVGGTSHQSVNIDHQRKVVNVDHNNGWDSWSSVLDYGTGFMATRILSKKTCFIVRMNKQIMPDITTLPKTIREKQKNPRSGPAPKEISFTVSHKKISDLSVYGKQVETFCQGIPSYLAFEIKKPSFFFSEGSSCFRMNILFILHISYCHEAMYD